MACRHRIPPFSTRAGRAPPLQRLMCVTFLFAVGLRSAYYRATESPLPSELPFAERSIDVAEV